MMSEWDQRKALFETKIIEFENNIKELFEKINSLDKCTSKEISDLKNDFFKELSKVKEQLLEAISNDKETSYKADSILNDGLKNLISLNSKDIEILRKEVAIKTSIYALGITGAINGLIEIIKHFAK